MNGCGTVIPVILKLKNNNVTAHESARPVSWGLSGRKPFTSSNALPSLKCAQWSMIFRCRTYLLVVSRHFRALEFQLHSRASALEFLRKLIPFTGPTRSYKSWESVNSNPLINETNNSIFTYYYTQKGYKLRESQNLQLCGFKTRGLETSL